MISYRDFTWSSEFQYYVTTVAGCDVWANGPQLRLFCFKKTQGHLVCALWLSVGSVP